MSRRKLEYSFIFYECGLGWISTHTHTHTHTHTYSYTLSLSLSHTQIGTNRPTHSHTLVSAPGSLSCFGGVGECRRLAVGVLFSLMMNTAHCQLPMRERGRAVGERGKRGRENGG